MKRLSILAVFFIVVIPISVQATVIAGPITNPSNGHRYYLLSRNSWTASETEAQQLGGHLVTINDQQEQDWVFATFATFGGTDRSLWIGLNDVASEGNFVWTSGAPVNYTHWSLSPSQPDNAGGVEHYVHMYRPNLTPPPDPPEQGGYWNDWVDNGGTPPEFEPVHGVVELPPAVPSLSLYSLIVLAVFLAGAAMWMLRRKIATSKILA